MLRDSGQLEREHLRLVAEGLGVSERTVRRWVALDTPKEPAPYELSETYREAFAYFHGNIAAGRARPRSRRCRSSWCLDGLGRGGRDRFALGCRAFPLRTPNKVGCGVVASR
ncbi:hypothetical protein GCM10009838_89020 [Catenulispora subtropica]|uniref:Uncharacterized protein n=1 Tax=Catenulispora subtropica TaxID=450798 RepID=A0ABP5EZB9_9ACTN